MKEHDLKISLTNIRAIEQADIILDGITVLTGENGCGKSTISKLAYYIFKTSIEFDAIVEDELRKKFLDVLDVLLLVYKQLPIDFDDILSGKEDTLENLIFETRVNLNTANEATIIMIFDELIAAVDLSNIDIDKSREGKATEGRIKRILEGSIKDEDENYGKEAETITNLLITFRELIKEKIVHSERLKKNRPIGLLYKELDSAFYDNPIPKTYVAMEYGQEIINRKKENILPFYLIQSVAYIDSPMMLGIGNAVRRFNHWKDLDQILSKSSNRVNGKNISQIFKEQILKGEAVFSSSLLSNKFIYKRKDGKEFNLLECATGIKSFAVLQILFKNGFLNNKTLLIIDEPEAHLHPQWVVEYARLIVLLHKHIGVRFLIASHHPDMVSAIKYISEKEQVDDKLHYYLAEQTGDEFKYNYKELGTDIEAIFESFNIAFERMDLYGNTE